MNIGDMAKVLKHLRRDPVVKVISMVLLTCNIMIVVALHMLCLPAKHVAAVWLIAWMDDSGLVYRKSGCTRMATICVTKSHICMCCMQALVNAVQAVYDAKSEEIGPGIYRFKAEIGNILSFTLSDHMLLHHSLKMWRQ